MYLCDSPTHANVFFFFLMLRPPPRSPLFPYTTLFRSEIQVGFSPQRVVDAKSRLQQVTQARFKRDLASTTRSEEHTSELQSRRDLVCRLLLEKKKKLKHPTGVLETRPTPFRRLSLRAR